MEGPGSSPRPEIVVSLPGRSTAEWREEIGKARRAGADLVELRLDRLNVSDLGRLSDIHRRPLLYEWVPAIATLRSRREGGEGPEEQSHRHRILRQALLDFPFRYVDLELDRDLGLIEEIQSLDLPPLDWVVSSHLPNGTPREEIVRRLEKGWDVGGLPKVVLPATMARCLDELIPLVRGLSGRRMVFHTTGPSGPLLRVLASRLGLAWVYASLPRGGSTARPETATVEPSQIPVDDLRSHLDQGPEGPWYAIVGHPLEHTRSPALFRRLCEVHKLPYIMVPLDFQDEEQFRQGLPALAEWGLWGCNVTLPFKVTAARLARHQSEEVILSGAANVLVSQPGGKGFRAANTDLVALRTILHDFVEEGVWDGLRLLLWGQGGAARAVCAAAVEMGASVDVLGRSPERVRNFCEDFPPEHVRPLLQAPERPYGLVVNATPVGQRLGLQLEVPLGRALGRGTLLFDLVYNPVERTLETLARRAGGTYRDGTRLLVLQAAESFRIFTGVEVSPDVLERLEQGEVGP
jgi:shikimate dehydrogenase/3-dehydroquinate dehydratase type I